MKDSKKIAKEKKFLKISEDGKMIYTPPSFKRNEPLDHVSAYSYSYTYYYYYYYYH
jgi:hypothetical protein